jgi:hypothetical protein
MDSTRRSWISALGGARRGGAMLALAVAGITVCAAGEARAQVASTPSSAEGEPR